MTDALARGCVWSGASVPSPVVVRMCVAAVGSILMPTANLGTHVPGKHVCVFSVGCGRCYVAPWVRYVGPSFCLYLSDSAAAAANAFRYRSFVGVSL